MSDQNELLFQLEALKKENAALRGQQAPEQEQQAPQEPPAPKPSKLEVEITKIIMQLRDLSLPNDPALDQVIQTAGRSQAMCKVIESLAVCVANGFGATGAMLNGLGDRCSALSQDLDALKAGALNVEQTAAVAGEGDQGEQGEVVELDNTGASPDHPAVQAAARAASARAASARTAPAKSSNGQKARAGSTPVAAPVGPPVGPPSAPLPPGMPAEVAQLQQAPLAPIAQVTVK